MQNQYASRIHQTLDMLEKALSGVASFDTKGTFQQENATYGEAYLKVGYKLGATLLASKEVLLVVADFPEVQTRNLRVAQDRLARGSGRLQSGVVVVAHRDDDGDGKLRAWGRELGLTVLPISCATDPPKGEALLHRMLEDLYSYDRFDLTGPVRSEYQFFGRPFIPDLARRLREGTIHALFGMRKIGKTSLLNRVLEELTTRQSCNAVMLDASDDSLSTLTAAGLIRSIRVAVGRINGGLGPYVSVVAADASDLRTPALEAQTLLEAVQQSRLPLVLLIDEVDYITPSSPVAGHWVEDFNPFFRAVRRVYQEATRGGPAFSLVLSGVSSRWFTEESVDGVENAALALVPEGYLQPLERSESVEMIETLGQACGLIFDVGSAAVIADAASDNPFWIRKAGSFINSCFPAERPVRVEKADVETLCAEFLEVEGNQLGYSSVRHLFRMYPDLGFAAVAAVEGHRRQVAQNLLSFLGRYGIIDEECAATGPMIAAGITRWKHEDSQKAQQLPFEDATQGSIEAGSASPTGEAEWADMLSDVSRMRNLLERRLRELIVVVVRSECAGQPQRKPADVVRAAVGVERRAELENLGAGQLMKRLYWLDLLQVVRKNWRWFERIFGERGKFDMWGEVINERPDSHAKDLDGADLALQRRAIEWFDSAIDRCELL